MEQFGTKLISDSQLLGSSLIDVIYRSECTWPLHVSLDRPQIILHSHVSDSEGLHQILVLL